MISALPVSAHSSGSTYSFDGASDATADDFSTPKKDDSSESDIDEIIELYG